MRRGIRAPRGVLILLLIAVTSVLPSGGSGLAQSVSDTTFHATLVDTGGLETDVTDLVFYWEEKLSETQLALHELKHVPAKRGAVPIQIQFSKIKRIDFQTPSGAHSSVLSVTLKNGKTGDFHLDIPGSFKGQTDFGEMIAKPSQLRKIVFK